MFFLFLDKCFTMFLLSEGLGRTAPDPRATVSLNGVDIPLGKGANTNIDDTSLLYNEYPLVFCIICLLAVFDLLFYINMFYINILNVFNGVSILHQVQTAHL